MPGLVMIGPVVWAVGELYTQTDTHTHTNATTLYIYRSTKKKKKKRPKTLSNSQDSMGQVTIETKENPSLESSRGTDP